MSGPDAVLLPPLPSTASSSSSASSASDATPISPMEGSTKAVVVNTRLKLLQDQAEQDRVLKSRGMREHAAKQQEREQQQFYLRGIPYKATCQDVYKLLLAHCSRMRNPVPDPIVQLEIIVKGPQLQQHEGGHSGQGYVRFKTREVATFMRELSRRGDITMVGDNEDQRHLRLLESGEVRRRHQNKARRDAVAFECQASVVVMGQVPPSGVRDPVSLDSFTKQVWGVRTASIVIDGRESDRQIKLLLGDGDKVSAELGFRNLRDIVYFAAPGAADAAATNGNGNSARDQGDVLRLWMHEPPILYGNATNPVVDAGNLGDVFMLNNFASFLSRVITTRTDADEKVTWDINDKVERKTVDPSFSRTNAPWRDINPFGRFPVYDLHIPKRADAERLIECLIAFGRAPFPSAGLVKPRIGVERFRPNKPDWAGGFGACFANLPFDIAYLLHGLISRNVVWFASEEHANKMADLLLTKAHDQVTAALESLFLVRIPGPNPYQAVSDAIDEAIKVHKRKVAHLVPARVEAAATATHQLSRSVLVTPLRVVPQLPEPKEGNRILRKYEAHLDRFLRVSLADEDRSSYYSARCKTMFEEWITPWIHSPMVVGGRSFVFLAYSNSQLREQSCWFYDEQPRPDSLTPPTAEEIRQNIGDLSAIHIPGKYGARLGQAFSTTTAATQVPVALTREIPDVERNGYCFSDGVGRMSPSLAEKIAGPLKVDTPPTAVQIRYQGCKGVVTLDPRLEGSDIQLELRPSMNKFTCSAEDSTLEVCNFARPSVFYLNRQTIVLMTALGVPDSAIEKHFQVMKDELEAAVIDDKAALQFMQSHAASTMVPMMLRSGFSIKSDRHLRELVAAQRNSLLLDLKNRARIRVPESVLMLGVMDEWNVLGPDEVYLSSNSDLFPLPPAGTRVLVGRSPSLHPGDLRLATLAAERPELAHLKEVIVFPQTGDRPLCNMMSGGDLDGDQFFCIWDKTLIPDHQVPPMEYEASSSVAAAINRAATKVDIEDVCKFFVDYMENDIVGALCNLHLAYADLMSAASPPCLQLAHIYTTAIDWPKTGVRAVLPPTLRRIARPDFMEAEFLDVYRSEKILGRIYRAMKDMASRAFAEYDRFSPECLEQALTGNVKPFDNGYDPTLTAAVPDHQRYMAEARDLYNAYALDWIKRSIMHDVHDEAELAIGFFRQAAMKKIRRKNWDESVSMVLDDIIALRNEYCDYFWDEFEESLPEKFVDLHQQSLWRESRCDRPDVVAKAVAWYRVAYEVVEDANPMNDRPVGAAAADPEVAEHIARLQYLGFAWLVPQPICRVKAGLVRKAADAVRWARR